MFFAHTDPKTHLLLSLKPQKLRVYLDYEEGKVSFHNVTGSHINTFTDMKLNPNEKLYPLFFTIDVNTYLVLESPVILQINHTLLSEPGHNSESSGISYSLSMTMSLQSSGLMIVKTLSLSHWLCLQALCLASPHLRKG
ncbi:UNVERIFIED_CONTAM: hypothetical protein FKN15_026433 [Acipenser sinensis]